MLSRERACRSYALACGRGTDEIGCLSGSVQRVCEICSLGSFRPAAGMAIGGFGVQIGRLRALHHWVPGLSPGAPTTQSSANRRFSTRRQIERFCGDFRSVSSRIFGLCQRLRVSTDGFWRFVSASKNSVPGGRDRARGWTAVPIENQSRTYWWCKPRRKFGGKKSPRSTVRENGASFSKERDVCGRHYIIFSCTTAAGGGGGIRRTRQRGRGIPVGSNRSVVRHTLPWRPWRRRLIANAH